MTSKVKWKDWFTEIFMPTFGLSQAHADMISDFLEESRAQLVDYHGLFSGTDPYEISSRIVSAIDATVFEYRRQANRELRKNMERLIKQQQQGRTR